MGRLGLNSTIVLWALYDRYGGSPSLSHIESKRLVPAMNFRTSGIASLLESRVLSSLARRLNFRFSATRR
jgi:hypothetical protein